jgi:hypothetical protein
MTGQDRMEHSQFMDKYHTFQAQQQNPFGKSSLVGGVFYGNAVYPEYDVYNPKFFAERHFDFISLCMALHHFTSGNEPHPLQALTSRQLIDESGYLFQGKSSLSDTQRSIIDRLLGKLNEGGCLFLNLFPSRVDQFYLIQRRQENIFRIHARTPIYFDNGRETFRPSLNWGFVEGRRLEERGHEGIRSYYNLTPKQKEQLQLMFDRADNLLIRHQEWNYDHGPSLYELQKNIQNRLSVPDIFCRYINRAPVSTWNERDQDLAKQLLADVEEWERAYERAKR